MSREGMLGRLPLALSGLPNNSINEAYEIVKLLSGEDGPAWAAHLGKVRRAGLPEQPKPALLKLFNAEICLDSIRTHNPAQFYEGEKAGHYFVGSEFKERVILKNQLIGSLPTLILRSFDLGKMHLFDHELIAELSEDGLFDESFLFARIPQMIKTQRNGEVGDLLNDGGSNLFYVEHCVVQVRWTGKWNILAWGIGVNRWHGARVFSHRSKA